jgi:hypothetical protein
MAGSNPFNPIGLTCSVHSIGPHLITEGSGNLAIKIALAAREEVVIYVI